MYAKLSAEVLTRLIPPGSRILAAVSGGPDSVALAHIIYRYLRENQDQNVSLVISHVNHKVRPESEQEAELVSMLARQWEAPFILHEFDSQDYALKTRQGFQEAAREWRYARFKEDMEAYGCNLLATAHHLGDQAETVLYRLIRGSGTAGLAGIYPAREQIIRPLLTVGKKEIMEYCQTCGLPYALDKTNFEPVYDRNRIRLELLPELEVKYNQRIQEALGRTAELLRWDEEYINAQVDRLWPNYSVHSGQGQLLISAEAWREPEAVLSRILRKAASLVSGEPRGLEYQFIKALMSEGRKTGWRQDLPGLRVEAAKNGLFFFRRELGKVSSQDWKVPLLVDEWQFLPGLELQAGVFQEPVSCPNLLWQTEFDRKQFLEIKNLLFWRSRRPGDRMYFKHLGHKTIKKVFQDHNISRAARKQIPFLAERQQVLWIPGICRSDRLLPSGEQAPRLYGAILKQS